MSRLPRAQEYLKTGFNAEAASAARFRAAAVRATEEGHPKLAEAWRVLAAEKDELARLQLEAALAEERYENDSLYPRMSGEVDAVTAAVFSKVVARQKEHLARLDSLLDAMTRSPGDISG